MEKLFAINPYTELGTEFDHIMLEVDHDKRTKTMDLRCTPVRVTQFGYEQVFDFQNNPLTKGIIIREIPMPRKNQKKMDAAFNDLCGSASHIVDLWNKRDFDGIKGLFS